MLPLFCILLQQMEIHFANNHTNIKQVAMQTVLPHSHLVSKTWYPIWLLCFRLDPKDHKQLRQQKVRTLVEYSCASETKSTYSETCVSPAHENNTRTQKAEMTSLIFWICVWCYQLFNEKSFIDQELLRGKMLTHCMYNIIEEPSREFSCGSSYVSPNGCYEPAHFCCYISLSYTWCFCLSFPFLKLPLQIRTTCCKSEHNTSTVVFERERKFLNQETLFSFFFCHTSNQETWHSENGNKIFQKKRRTFFNAPLFPF